MEAQDYWHMLEAEGRLRRYAFGLREIFYTLRLTPEERERLCYTQPNSLGERQ